MTVFGATTATVVKRGWDGTTRDRQNNKVLSVLSTFQIAGCFLQQRNTDETLDGRDTTETSWVLIGPPPSAALAPEDLIRIAAADANTTADPGQTYATFEQDGHPDQPQHIDGAVHHIELILRRVQL